MRKRIISALSIILCISALSACGRSYTVAPGPTSGPAPVKSE
jgi:hypothetical protein